MDKNKYKYGEEVFDTSPPMAEQNSEHDPKTHELYNGIESELPLGELL